MEFLFAFLVGFIGTAVVGGLARLLAGYFTVISLPGTAAFCVALGYVMGRFGKSGPFNHETALLLTTFGGAALALFLVWLLLVKRQAAEVAGLPPTETGY